MWPPGPGTQGSCHFQCFAVPGDVEFAVGLVIVDVKCTHLCLSWIGIERVLVIVVRKCMHLNASERRFSITSKLCA